MTRVARLKPPMPGPGVAERNQMAFPLCPMEVTHFGLCSMSALVIRDQGVRAQTARL